MDFWPENWQEHVFDINNGSTPGGKKTTVNGI